MHSFHTPLRYPGGKGQLANFFKLVVSQNGLSDGHYAEVYAGGAGIAMALLLEQFVSCVHVNDIDHSIYSFWHSILEAPDELCRLVHDTPVTMESWHRQKLVQSDPNNHSELELGFSTFFLNRTNRSGIIWAGVIGGKAQTGKWRLDARFNKPDLIKRIERIALYRSRIKVYNQDAEQFIRTVLPSMPKSSLVYLDPPYYIKGEGLYENHYSHEDHLRIARIVQREIKQNWIVSYDNVQQIRDMYKRCHRWIYELSYNAQDRYQGAEIMFFSPNLRMPDVANPAFVKLSPNSIPLSI